MPLAIDPPIINPDRPENPLEAQKKLRDLSTVGWTDESFLQLPDDGHHYEIINGKLVDMGNSGALHGYICSTLMILLGSYIRDKKLGAIFDSSTAFQMASGNKRSPDIAFFAKDRLQGISLLTSSFLVGAPDLAVEVLSPGNTVAEIDGKLEEYFVNGCRLVWIIHPVQRYVLVYRHAQQPDYLLKDSDQLTGEEVVPGFSANVASLLEVPNFG
jgi:Uma2 family endonuclease